MTTHPNLEPVDNVSDLYGLGPLEIICVSCLDEASAVAGAHGWLWTSPIDGALYVARRIS